MVDLGTQGIAVKLQGPTHGRLGSVIEGVIAGFTRPADVHLAKQRVIAAILRIALDAILVELDGLLRGQHIIIRSILRLGLRFGARRRFRGEGRWQSRAEQGTDRQGRQNKQSDRAGLHCSSMVATSSPYPLPKVWLGAGVVRPRQGFGPVPGPFKGTFAAPM